MQVCFDDTNDIIQFQRMLRTNEFLENSQSSNESEHDSFDDKRSNHSNPFHYTPFPSKPSKKDDGDRSISS